MLIKLDMLEIIRPARRTQKTPVFMVHNPSYVYQFHQILVISKSKLAFTQEMNSSAVINLL
jgi:hypothetical protein